ncbi:uncharacterized protein EAF02_009623 [Botrytis sinoallii]|uniref:uncharacterized protein n=1 Tax=Botrytis sinoallii TaxID=1463999 RepID=UPI0019005460|nr:uncharacterized protein EAF02_009623 [Botrytis sinoallii]KAF7868887.1 hypothetical protein EAF02_009623 [Botrytis sinoallii]
MNLPRKVLGGAIRHVGTHTTMNHLKDAVQADIIHKCERLGESILDPYMRHADYDGCWERISALMEIHCSRWTPARVEYAWTHGAANLFPDVVLSS